MGTPELILIFLLYYIINPHGETWSRSPKMKIVLGLVGLILMLAMFSTAAEDQEISFSEDIVQNRVGRDAVAASIGKKKSKKRKGRKRKNQIKKKTKKNRKRNRNGDSKKGKKSKKIDRSTA